MSKSYNNLGYISAVPEERMASDNLRRHIINALCVRLNRKWEIGIFTPQHPFFPGIIISDKLFGGCPLSTGQCPVSLWMFFWELVEYSQLQKKDLQ